MTQNSEWLWFTFWLQLNKQHRLKALNASSQSQARSLSLTINLLCGLIRLHSSHLEKLIDLNDWEKFPQIIFSVETWHSLIWHLNLVTQQHSSPLIRTNDCFIQCISFEVLLLKKNWWHIHFSSLCYDSGPAASRAIRELIPSEHLGSLRAQSLAWHHVESLGLSQLPGALIVRRTLQTFQPL